MSVHVFDGSLRHKRRLGGERGGADARTRAADEDGGEESGDVLAEHGEGGVGTLLVGDLADFPGPERRDGRL